MADQWDDIDEWGDGVFLKQLQGATVGVSTQVTFRTPVDKGLLRASWNWGVGAPDPTLQESTSRDTIAYLRGQIKTFGLGDIGYFTNPQPYAWPMELGGSAQAPNGMVRVPIANWQEINDKIARL